MKDKEAIGKLAKYLFEECTSMKWTTESIAWKSRWYMRATSILDILQELGYRKMPENPPPVLNMKQLTVIMKDCWTNTVPLGETDLEKYATLSRSLAFEVATAQRDADVEYYLGGSR